MNQKHDILKCMEFCDENKRDFKAYLKNSVSMFLN